MTLTGIDFSRMLYLMGADRGEDFKGEYEDSFIDDDEFEESRNRLIRRRRRPL